MGDLPKGENSGRAQTRGGVFFARKISKGRRGGKIVPAVAALALAAAAAGDALAQSTRFYKGPRMERVPESVILERESKDFDFYLGRIVRRDADAVIVHITGSPPRNLRSRPAIFYALDEKMRAIAVLEDGGNAFRNCATFKIARGDAKRGDIVMVKYLAPKKPGDDETPAAPETSAQPETPAQSETQKQSETPGD